jgi:hypothetical protein
MRTALACVLALAVAVVVTAAMVSSDYKWWESVLVGVFCCLPVFLLGAWWAERRSIAEL